MKPKFILIVLILLCNHFSFSQPEYSAKIDSLLSAPSDKPFNGVILISQKDKPKYSKIVGYSNLDSKTPLQFNDQFVIGSISKQFTAVLVLREYEKGSIELFVPIRKYLPELKQSWADTVTIHHLLTHTHGITYLNEAASFKAGTQYSYSQMGFELLARIEEHTSGKSFAELSKELFQICEWKNTFHPDLKQYKNLVNGYTEQDDGSLVFEKESLINYVAAGSFISTVNDLLKWNACFYEGKLLSKKTMKLLTTKQKGAVRDHPIFGRTEYGYGITVDTKENILQYGQTGFFTRFCIHEFLLS